jgi:hypothetical protein
MKKFLLLSVLLLCSCADPALSRQDNWWLREIRNHWFDEKGTKDSILYHLVTERPPRLAEKAAQDGDFRLISLAMGYHATEKDATIFGVECTEPVETKPVVFGCVPPPPVIFRQIMRYNTTLIRHLEFPAAHNCRPDGRAEEVLNKMSAELEESRVERRKDKKQKPRLFNP